MANLLTTLLRPTLRKKLLGVLIAIVTISSIGSIFALRTIIQVTREFNRLLNTDTPRLATLLEFQNVSKDIEAGVVGVQLLEKEAASVEFSKIAQKKFEILANAELLRTLEERYKSYGDLDESRASFLQKMANFRERILPLALDLLYLQETGAEKTIVTQKVNIVQGETLSLREVIRKRVRDEQSSLVEIQNKIGIEQIKATSFGSLIIFLTIVIVLGIGIAFSQIIIRSILALDKAAGKIAAGELGGTVEVRSRDEIGGLAATFNEMSRRLKNFYERLAEAKAKDEALLRSIGDGVVAVDQEEKIILINDAAQRMLVWEAEEVLGKNWFEVLRVEDEKGNLVPREKRPFHLALTVGTTTTTTTTTYYYVRKDGTRFPVAITVAPIRNEKIEGAVVVFRDVTEEKEFDRAKTEFVAITAHELRTPLTIIFGSAERILKLLSRRKIDHDIAEMIVDIRDEGSRLIKIVNDFLDLVVLEQGGMLAKNEKIDLEKTIKEVIKPLEAKFKTKKLSLAFTPPDLLPLVLADKERVKQVLENLISNAIQYTKEGGIIITLENNGSFVKTFITDTGIGVPPERQKSLFQKFQTIGDRFLRSKEYGSGMGLYISKMLVETMGGVIRLEKSEMGRGSTFSFTLPIAS